jgi:hypothetical protein
MKHYQLTEATACRFHELTKVEIIVWCYIKASDPFCSAPVPGPTAIARATGLGKSSVSEALKSLKSKGWSVRADEHIVRADEQSVRTHEQNVRADEHIVRADEQSVTKTRINSEFQEPLDPDRFKDSKTEKERESARAIASSEQTANPPSQMLGVSEHLTASSEQTPAEVQRPSTKPRSSSTPVADGKGSAVVTDPDFLRFVLKRAESLPQRPKFPNLVARKMLETSRAELWADYQASKAGPSIAAEILARGVTGTSTDPWPTPQTKPAPMPDTTAQRLAAKWSIPALRHQVKAECDRLGIPCTEDGPQLASLTA